MHELRGIVTPYITDQLYFQWQKARLILASTEHATLNTFGSHWSEELILYSVIRTVNHTFTYNLYVCNKYSVYILTYVVQLHIYIT